MLTPSFSLPGAQPMPIAPPGPPELSERAVEGELSNAAELRSHVEHFVAADVRAPAESLERVALLHSLIAAEVDYLRAAEEPVPVWMLAALDETEWAAAA